MIELKNGIPVVDVVRVRTPGQKWDQAVILVCPYCGKRHYHGFPEGHRWSHCSIQDKDDDGYYLRDVLPGRAFSSVKEAVAELAQK